MGNSIVVIGVGTLKKKTTNRNETVIFAVLV